ncbi:hypothetical protein Mtc_0235 [Methanocella conradii HZ254]|uniref:PepSY domain-containing protein n=1 Tax=Methanocella conradii (strain DSM 24694 / JCM 17849 / CGMCC 1.5162 / HZ254) TaxID=1041930 RepID=H8I8F3_METCZ|nr:hypothetical protein [Methanocella conradii]AFC99006.1 hypothetical protein Mtc_0235 [Methanocella conradii HZ254]
MVKMAYVIIGAALVLSLAVIGAAVYLDNDKSPNANTLNNTRNESNGIITALQAYSIAENDSQVRGWKKSARNVSIAQISSDFCDSGLSDTWHLTYSSDTEEASVYIKDGALKGITIEKTAERLYPYAKESIDSLIDSPGAWDIAINVLENESARMDGPASATLTLNAAGKAVWDLNCKTNVAFYIVRIDAKGGDVIAMNRVIV